MIFRQLFDAASGTYTYLIADAHTREAVLIDPVLEQAQRDTRLIHELDLTLCYSIETHVHADHITGASKLKQLTGCRILYPASSKVELADALVADNEQITLGNIVIKCLHTPGHTDCSYCYLINADRILTGDTLLIRGCGRTDFQNGDAGALYDSVMRKIFTLDDKVLVYPGHDYHGMLVSTVGEEKRFNPRLAYKSREEFITLMERLKLEPPKKIGIAVPANKLCGSTSLN